MHELVYDAFAALRLGLGLQHLDCAEEAPSFVDRGTCLHFRSLVILPSPENGNGEPDWLWRYAKRWSFKGARYDDKSCEMEFSVRATPDFVAWLAGQAPDIEVKAPESLRRTVADRVAAAAKLYGKKAR